MSRLADYSNFRIAAVRLTDFRTHERTEIEFSGGLTSIIGANNSGKSAIIKGLDIALNCGQFPERHKRRYKGEREAFSSVEVDIETPGGVRTIVRQLDGKEQKLRLVNAKRKATEYTALKDPAIAQMVADFTGIRKDPLDPKSSECIQIVHLENSRPFLIVGHEDATVLKKVNLLSKGARLEAAKVALESKVRAIDKSASISKGVYDRAVAKLKSISKDGWGPFGEKLEKVQRTLGKLLNAKLVVNELDAVIDSFDTFTTLIDADAVTALEQQVARALDAKRALDELRLKFQKACRAVDDYESAISDTALASQRLDDAESELATVAPSKCAKCNKMCLMEVTQ